MQQHWVLAVSLCMRSNFVCPQAFLQFGLDLCDVDSGVLESCVNSTLRSHFRTGSHIALQPLAGVSKQGYQDYLIQEAAHGQQGADVPWAQKKETFSWLGYGQLDDDRFNLRYSKMLSSLFTVQCAAFHTTIHKHLTGMQRMCLFTPANSNVQAVNSVRKDGQSSRRRAASQMQDHCTTRKLHLSHIYKAFGRILCHPSGM